MSDEQIEHPWQAGPVELIRYAIFHVNRGSDFDHRIAFLLLDVGVETLFKTYLQLPENITNTKVPYGKRKVASEGNFHELIEGIELAGKHVLEGIDLNHVRYYHELRNKLYHQGNGITIPTDKVRDYAKIAVELLNRLLIVDLTDDLTRPELEKRHLDERDVMASEFNELKDILKKKKENLENFILATIEKIDPTLALPSFRKTLSDWQINVRNRINKWMSIAHLNDEELSQDHDGLVSIPTGLVEELFNDAPSALKTTMEKYHFIKLRMIRASLYYETNELMLSLIKAVYKFPDYEGSLYFDYSLLTQISPDNPPFHILEQNDFDPERAMKQLILDENDLSGKFDVVIHHLEKILNQQVQ